MPSFIARTAYPACTVQCLAVAALCAVATPATQAQSAPTLAGSVELAGGSHGLVSSFNTPVGRSGTLDYQADLSNRKAGGQRSSISRTVPLLGIDIGNDFGQGNETYLNVSQGYRPVRYQEFASPNGNFDNANEPDPTKYMTYEAGVHGWPLPGVFYNVSVSQVNTVNKIESQATGKPGQTVNVNSGDARSRGLEAEINDDLPRLLDSKASGRRLALSLNASLMDAKITDSKALVATGGPTPAGNTPAHAPKSIVSGVVVTPAKIPQVTLYEPGRRRTVHAGAACDC